MCRGCWSYRSNPSVAPFMPDTCQACSHMPYIPPISRVRFCFHRRFKPRLPKTRNPPARVVGDGKSTEVDFVYSLAANSFAVDGRVSGLLVVSVQSVRCAVYARYVPGMSPYANIFFPISGVRVCLHRGSNRAYRKHETRLRRLWGTGNPRRWISCIR